MTAPSLPEFIEARVREDQYAANLGRGDDGSIPPAVARVLRQCEAIREMVEEMERETLNDPKPAPDNARWLLGRLASFWADHDDFRAEWAA